MLLWLWKLSAPGALNVSGELALRNNVTVTFNDDVTASTIQQTSGTMTGPADITATSGFSWTGGTQSGTGTTFVEFGGTLGNTMLLTDRDLVLANSQTVTMTNGQLYVSGAASLDNQGLLELQSGADILFSGSVGTVNNAGVITVDSAGTTRSI